MDRVSIAATWSGKGLRLDQERLRKLCTQLPVGDVIVTIEKAVAVRSSQQNRFWHGVVIPLFAEHCGNELPEMKRALALELLPVEITKLDGTTAIVPGHTSELTTKQFKDLIERAQRLGATMNIYIPDPDEVHA